MKLADAQKFLQHNHRGVLVARRLSIYRTVELRWDNESRWRIREAFSDLGARLGSLEGYLYAEEKVEKKYLAGMDRQH